MSEAVSFIAENGYWLVALGLALRPLGIPIPSSPILLGAGALAAQDRLQLPLLVAVSALAGLPSDWLLYELGRRRGSSLLRLLCRISLEPDSCVRQTEVAFENRGSSALLWAKFVPGLALAAAPLAGGFRIPRRVFVGYDALGSFLYTSAYIGLGYLFDAQISAVLRWVSRFGRGGVSAVFGALAVYWAWKAFQRQRMIRLLRTRRVTPEELWARMNAGEAPLIVDLRPFVAFTDAPKALPGARRMSMEEIEVRHRDLPRDRDLILYCT